MGIKLEEILEKYIEENEKYINNMLKTYGWDECHYIFKAIVKTTPRKSEIKAKKIWRELMKENPAVFKDRMRVAGYFDLEDEFLRKHNLVGPITVIFLGLVDVDIDTFSEYYSLHYKVKIKLKRWLESRKKVNEVETVKDSKPITARMIKASQLLDNPEIVGNKYQKEKTIPKNKGIKI